jgi:hypothetical protein
MNEWRPIETAPKDGTKILVCRGGEPYVAYWSSVWHPDSVMWVADIPNSNPPTVAALGPEFAEPWTRHGPTHWLPIPEMPGTERELALENETRK